MREKIISWRGFAITKRELIADTIFLLTAALVSFFAMIIFNIHWSFYPNETIFPLSKTVGISAKTYFVGTLVGAIVVFFIIKLILLGVREEEIEWMNKSNKNKK